MVEMIGTNESLGRYQKSFHVRHESLVKKTIKVKSSDDPGATWRIVSYYRPADVLQGRLLIPMANQDFALQLWHVQKTSISYRKSSNSHLAGESIWPAKLLWDINLSAGRRDHLSWDILSNDSGHYHAGLRP
jgi:hypothetical protein